MEWLGAVVAVIAAISGMALGWSARAREAKKDARMDGSNDGALKTDVEYIKSGIDEIKKNMQAQTQRMDGLAERLARCEERLSMHIAESKN